MKTKLKETLINLALNNERYRKLQRIFLIVMALTGCLILLFKVPKIPVIIWLFVSIAFLILLKCLEAIKKNELILDRNKLVNIIFSSEDVLYYTFLYVVIYPVLVLINSKITIFSFVICAAGLAILGIFLSKKISKYFDKKLKKIEFLR